jgi:hypothetical protein
MGRWPMLSMPAHVACAVLLVPRPDLLRLLNPPIRLLSPDLTVAEATRTSRGLAVYASLGSCKVERVCSIPFREQSKTMCCTASLSEWIQAVRGGAELKEARTALRRTSTRHRPAVGYACTAIGQTRHDEDAAGSLL